MGMAAIPLKDLKADTYYNAPVFIDDSYIILTPETPMTLALIHRLAEWEIREVFTSGSLIDSDALPSEPESTEEGDDDNKPTTTKAAGDQIGRASCRERVYI